MKRLLIIILILYCFPAGAYAFDLHSETADGSLRITSHYRQLSPGEIVKISLESPVFSSAWARFDGRTYMFVPAAGETSFFTFISLGLDISPGYHVLNIGIRYPEGYEKNFSIKLTVSERKFPLKRLTVNKRFFDLPPGVLKRVLREKAQVDAIYGMITPAWLGCGCFIVPTPGTMRDNFGERRIFNGEFRSRHRGVDISCPRGTDIKASNAGKVLLTGNLYYAGKTVIIDHGAGLSSHYCHLSTIRVREGETVEKGTIIGQVGATGRVTGPHLHWGVKLLDQPVDPLSLVHLTFAE